MNSPMSRVILSVLVGYVLILLFLTGRDWYRAEYPRPPAEPAVEERIRYPRDHERAKEALERFRGLPRTERAAILRNLESRLVSVEQWLSRLEQSNVQILCLGEHHEESTRAFLADAFFARIHQWFPLLDRRLFQPYEALLLFRS